MTKVEVSNPIYGALVGGRSVRDDQIFQSDATQDDRNSMYKLLQVEFAAKGIRLHTLDVLKKLGHTPSFEIHINARAIKRLSDALFVLLIETSATRPINGNWDVLTQYRKIFTWRDDWLSEKPNTIKIAGYPIPLKVPAIDTEKRGRLCCMIASNKTCQSNDVNELYSERVKTVQWFERNRPSCFDLYGPGWQYPVAQSGWRGLIKKEMNKVWPLFKPAAQICYRGVAPSKQNVLLGTQFNICYENVGNMPGYITEKIFDAMGAGCIPIYWGPDIDSIQIPKDCFLHRPSFQSHEALFEFMSQMSLKEIQRRQTVMREYMQSPEAQRHSTSYFAKSVSEAIIHDLSSNQL